MPFAGGTTTTKTPTAVKRGATAKLIGKLAWRGAGLVAKPVLQSDRQDPHHPDWGLLSHGQAEGVDVLPGRLARCRHEAAWSASTRTPAPAVTRVDIDVREHGSGRPAVSCQ
jgi:hypothetical protein